MKRLLLTTLLILIVPISGTAQKKKAGGGEVLRDLEYAVVDGVSLKLDLHLPKKKVRADGSKPELVVFFHGGSWRAGSKKNCHVAWLTNYGYAVASIDYRLSGQAKFPALVHDCKGAVRWLRANAEKLGVNARRICASGASAGGLLATLLATSGGVEALEGSVGGNLDQSSRVQSAIGMFCPTDLYYNATAEQERCDQPNCPLYQLMGGKPSEQLDRVRLASATEHVTADDPPLVLLYGSEDKSLVKPLHGERLRDRYAEAGLRATYQLIQGAGHGGPQYRDEERRALILPMLEKTLRSTSHYLIGNSLTWDTIPGLLDGDVQWHVDCGKPLPFLYGNPDKPCVKTSTLWPLALESKRYDYLSVQPHYGSTVEEDAAVISKWMTLQPQATLVLHSGWAYHAEREAEHAADEARKMTHCPAYFDALLAKLKAKHPKTTFRRTRAMALLQQVAADVKAGSAPIDDVAKLYRDKIHLTHEAGRYLMHNAMRHAHGQPRSAKGFEGKTTPEMKKYLDSVLDRVLGNPN